MIKGDTKNLLRHHKSQIHEKKTGKTNDRRDIKREPEIRLILKCAASSSLSICSSNSCSFATDTPLALSVPAGNNKRET